MKTIVGMMLVLVSMVGFAIAGEGYDVPVTPEINAGSAATAVTLLGGALLVVRSRIKK